MFRYAFKFISFLVKLGIAWIVLFVVVWAMFGAYWGVAP